MHIGFAGLLTITLLLLKAFKVIGISWWWVFAPLPVAFVFSILLFFGLIMLKVWADR